MAPHSRTGLLAGITTLALLLAPGVARPQNFRNCAWPVELSPEGTGNFLAPEALARYWLMPFDVQDGTMTIHGAYPAARYFSFVVYDTDVNRIPTGANGHLYDAVITPDAGSTNPFVPPGGAAGTYTIQISGTGATSGNSIRVGTPFSWIGMRLYVPSPDPSLSGRASTGGVPLPTITLTKDGTTRTLSPCSPVNKLDDLVAFQTTLFPSGFDLIGDEGTPATDRLWFGAPTVPPPLLLPNPDNKYILMFPGNDYQPGRIIVIRGRAPSYPGTASGSPVWDPARGFRSVDVRFWSMCNTDFVLPVGTVDCVSDLTAHLEGGWYTIVVSDDVRRPDWLRPDVTWVPWGDEQYPKLMFFRNMLSAPGFTSSIQAAIDAHCTFDFNLPYLPPRSDVDTAGQCAAQIMGDYYPVAAWCDRDTFVHGGWKACLKGRAR